MHKSTAAVLIVVGLIAGLVAGFLLGNRYVTRLGYQELRERGVSDKEIVKIIRAMPNTNAVLQQGEDFSGAQAMLIYKLLLLQKEDQAKGKLKELVRRYYQIAHKDPAPDEGRQTVLRRIEELEALDGDLLKGLK